MKTIQTSRSMQTFFNEIAYTEAALDASPLTVKLVESSRDLRGEWFEIAKKESLIRLGVICASAKIRVKSQELQMIVREFCGVLLVQTNQSRESTLYRRFFKVSPSKMAQLPIRRQLDIVEKVIVPEIESLDENHILRTVKEKLTNAANEVKVELDGAKTSRAARQSNSLDVEDWKDKVNALRMTIFGELLQIAGEQERGRSWAENFFNRRSYKRIENEEEVETEEMPELAPPVEASESEGEQAAA